MSKDRRKSVNIHSSVLDKQPTPATLELGELAVNTAPNGAFISTKNSQNKVVRFSEDGTIINWMELKEVFPYEASVNGSNADGSIGDPDLWENKSCINIKLNQIVGVESPHKSDVNGAMDIFNREINPIVRDTSGKPIGGGAGLSIDMSRYAMIGANPSFSSTTVSTITNLNGTTNIYGGLVGSGNTAKLHFCDLFDVASDNISFSSCTEESGVFTVDMEDACIVGTRKINVYGNETYIGVDCDGTTIANSLNLSGETIEMGARDCAWVYGLSGTTIGDKSNCENGATSIYGQKVIVHAKDSNLGLTAKKDIVESAESGITITAGVDLCESAGNKASFFGVSSTTIGMSCDGSSVASSNIIIGRTPSTTSSQINATTVDGAIEEAFNRSKMSMSVVEHTPQSEILKTYKLFQDGVQVGEDINIPKDHVLKDARIVYGGFTDISGTFVDCEELGGENCHYYIEFTWNVFDPSSGHADDKVTYLPCDDFIQVVEAENDPLSGITTSVKFEDGKYKVSANTSVNVAYGNGSLVQAKQSLESGFTLSAGTLTLKVEKGVPSAYSNTFDVFQANKTFTFNVPSAVSHLTRGTLTLTLSNGKPTSSSAQTQYDATSNNEFNVTVPSSLDHLSEYNGTVGGEGCYMFNHDICMSSNTVVAQGFYASSDRNLKENINPLMHSEYSKSDNVSFKTFNFKDDESKTKTYGVIAQDVAAAGLDEIVHRNADGTLNVDYISLLILKMASLENKVNELSEEIKHLKGEQ